MYTTYIYIYIYTRTCIYIIYKLYYIHYIIKLPLKEPAIIGSKRLTPSYIKPQHVTHQHSIGGPDSSPASRRKLRVLFGFQGLVAHPCLVFLGVIIRKKKCQTTCSKLTLRVGPFKTSQDSAPRRRPRPLPR